MEFGTCSKIHHALQGLVCTQCRRIVQNFVQRLVTLQWSRVAKMARRLLLIKITKFLKIINFSHQRLPNNYDFGIPVSTDKTACLSLLVLLDSENTSH